MARYENSPLIRPVSVVTPPSLLWQGMRPKLNIRAPTFCPFHRAPSKTGSAASILPNCLRTSDRRMFATATYRTESSRLSTGELVGREPKMRYQRCRVRKRRLGAVIVLLLASFSGLADRAGKKSGLEVVGRIPCGRGPSASLGETTPQSFVLFTRSKNGATL